VRIYVTGAVPSAISGVLAEDFEVVDAVEGADGILSLLTTTVDAALLDRAGPQLRLVANYAVGVNNIDLDAARARGVLVANTPDVLTRPTAELAVTLMLTLLRRVT
jgi:glyoxylate reductase